MFLLQWKIDIFSDFTIGYNHPIFLKLMLNNAFNKEVPVSSLIFHIQPSPSIPVPTRMTLVLSSFLRTFQVNDTWLLSKIKFTIGKAGVKLLLPVL